MLDIITRLHSRHPTIKFDFKILILKFLDTKIYKNKENNKLLTTICQKPTDQRNSWILHQHNPRLLINSITFSQAPWLKKIYPELLEVHKHLHGLTESFIKRGYKENFLIDQFNKISEITREALLTSKTKAANKPRIPLPLKFNRTLTNTLRKSLTLAFIIDTL